MTDPYAMHTKGDDAILRAARADEGSLLRVWAIAELARRAVARHELLPTACKAITEARGREQLQAGLPLGYLGAQRLLESGDGTAVGSLLREMDTWSQEEQRMFFHLCAGNSVPDLLDRYQHNFGWQAKFSAS